MSLKPFYLHTLYDKSKWLVPGRQWLLSLILYFFIYLLFVPQILHSIIIKVSSKPPRKEHNNKTSLI